jgi:hypothetical protein
VRGGARSNVHTLAAEVGKIVGVERGIEITHEQQSRIEPQQAK